ncbi:uncharacterized protein [Nicotiana tomentosiformis]|uniref:uncharacterized protein n=1 Tax=Nicotiana tomentosiformis TaxID=4098 RepID=UPI00388C8072
MVADAFGMHFGFETHESVEQPLKEEAKYFYEQLDTASRPLREERMHSQLSVAVNKKPSWVLPHLWEDLQRYWTTEKFEKQSELGKKARAYEKGGSLHCVGAMSMGAMRRLLENKYGRKMTHDEFFMETHIQKKKESTDPTKWGLYKINVEEYTQSLPPNEQGERPPLSDEEAQRIWLDVVGGPKKWIAYGLPEKLFRRYRDGLQGIGTSTQGEIIDRSTILSIEQKIAKLTTELEETKLANLLVSGAFPIPRSREPSSCADDEGSRSEDGDDAK